MSLSFVAQLKAAPATRVAIEHRSGKRIGMLELVAMEHAKDWALLQQICDWHNQSLASYLDPTPWLPDSTAKWLTTSMIPANDRVLFLVYSDLGTRVGLCGLSAIGANQAEIYDIVRGDAGGHPQLFPFAQIALLRLSFAGIGLQSVVGTVQADNLPARRMGYFVGFEERESSADAQPYAEEVGTQPSPGTATTRRRLHLRITRDRFLAKHPTLGGLPEFVRNSDTLIATG